MLFFIDNLDNIQKLLKFKYFLLFRTLSVPKVVTSSCKFLEISFVRLGHGVLYCILQIKCFGPFQVDTDRMFHQQPREYGFSKKWGHCCIWQIEREQNRIPKCGYFLVKSINAHPYIQCARVMLTRLSYSLKFWSPFNICTGVDQKKGGKVYNGIPKLEVPKLKGSKIKGVPNLREYKVLYYLA